MAVHRVINQALVDTVARGLHDQRSALTGVVGYAGLMADADDLDRAQHWAGKILQASGMAETVLDELRAGIVLNRMPSGHLRSVSPAELARGVAERLNGELSPERTVMVAAVEVEDLRVFAPAQWLEILISDLVIELLFDYLSVEIAVSARPGEPIDGSGSTHEVTVAVRGLDENRVEDEHECPQPEFSFTHLLVEALGSTVWCGDESQEAALPSVADGGAGAGSGAGHGPTCRCSFTFTALGT